MVSTGLEPLCDCTLLADWEDLQELELLLSLEDITNHQEPCNFLKFSSFFSRNQARNDTNDITTVCCKTYINDIIYESQISN